MWSQEEKKKWWVKRGCSGLASDRPSPALPPEALPLLPSLPLGTQWFPITLGQRNSKAERVSQNVYFHYRDSFKWLSHLFLVWFVQVTDRWLKRQWWSEPRDPSTMPLWSETDLCLLFQINNMKTKFKETIEKCDNLEHRLNDLLKEKQSVERK